jgi:hypothetical protein
MKQKREKPFKLDMPFDEALARFTLTNPKETETKMINVKDDPNSNGVVHESDLVLPALRFMTESPNGFIETSNLIIRLEELFAPSGKDAEIIEGRSDTFFSQKVRNLISHRTTKKSFIANGFAKYDEKRHGLEVTDSGRALLKQLNG